jgi:hypothetical protein
VKFSMHFARFDTRKSEPSEVTAAAAAAAAAAVGCINHLHVRQPRNAGPHHILTVAEGCPPCSLSTALALVLLLCLGEVACDCLGTRLYESVWHEWMWHEGMNGCGMKA